MGEANEARAIRTVSNALDWGDGWVSAYVELLDHTEQLEHQVFMLQTRTVILEAEALLLRYDMAKALGQVLEPA